MTTISSSTSQPGRQRLGQGQKRRMDNNYPKKKGGRTSKDPDETRGQQSRRSQAKRQRERNADDTENDAIDTARQDRAMETRIQRPLRTLIPSRKAVEARAAQAQGRTYYG
jgi:hypothetical protein